MNLQKMMQQAQAMQAKMADAQAKLEAQEFEGSAGGGAVKVRITGKGHALAVTLDAAIVDPADKETLEDSIVAAFNDAREKMESSASSAMSSVTAGLQLPPGFKMPI